MKHVYIGKPYKNGHEVCMVIDSNISTGDALVYNRHTAGQDLEELPAKIAEKYNVKIRAV